MTRAEGAQATTRLDEVAAATPGYDRLKSVNGMTGLFFTSLRLAFKPPYPWLRDALVQTSIGIQRSFIPLALSIFFFTYGTAFTTIAGVVQALGTPDRYGAGLITGLSREPVYWITSMVFAGVIGSSITSDLGAQKIREELDAIMVLGIDPIRSLVVPRIAALAFIGPIALSLGLVLSVGVAYITTPVLNTPRAVFIDTARAFMTSEDLISLLLRGVVTGLIVGVVACYKGLEASGGAEGVGRAVKETVAITFIGLWTLNTFWNEFYLAVWHNVPLLRG